MIKKVFLFWVLLSGISTAFASASEATSTLHKLLAAIQTFRANFTQTIHGAEGERLSQTQGEVLIQRPGRFYWKSQAPDPVLVVADGRFLWTYDVELAQVTKQPLQEALQNSPAALLAGPISHLTKIFHVTYAKKEQCRQENTACFLLRPKQQDATFSDIFVGFSQEKLTEVKMKDPLGQDIHTFFSNVELNPKLPSERFRFTPPAGVDVIQALNMSQISYD